MSLSISLHKVYECTVLFMNIVSNRLHQNKLLGLVLTRWERPLASRCLCIYCTGPIKACVDENNWLGFETLFDNSHLRHCGQVVVHLPTVHFLTKPSAVHWRCMHKITPHPAHPTSSSSHVTHFNDTTLQQATGFQSPAVSEQIFALLLCQDGLSACTELKMCWTIQAMTNSIYSLHAQCSYLPSDTVWCLSHNRTRMSTIPLSTTILHVH